jgi:tetratricopeptide (TPR) repeat protein
LADAYRKAGMLQEALEICEKGVKRHPRYASGFVVQGKCHYDLGNGEQAKRAFRRVLEMDHNNLVALKYIGLILAERGETEAAKASFQQILALDPDNKQIRTRLEDLDDIEEADAPTPEMIVEPPDVDDEEFEGDPISLGTEPEAPDDLATVTLADIYASQGYVEKARKIYQEVLRKEPENEHVKKKLADLDGETGSFAQVVDTMDEEPESPESGFVRIDSGGEIADPVVDSPDETDAPREEAPPEPRKPATPSQRADTGNEDVADSKSYEQFKRWLKNLS